MLGQQQRNQVYQTTQDTQTEVDAFSHIKKDQYLTKVFCWIQQGNTANIKLFYNTFPHLINQLYTPNHWNPLMYAVRYGNLELIQFLNSKGMKPNVQGIYNHVSIIHCAVYSGQVQILSYVINNIYKNANPTNCQTSPLKIAMKTGNPKMVQLLIAKGAYYTFGDVLNNLLPKQPTAEESGKYTTIDTGRQISNALVVEDTTIKDCPIKQTLRWARIRQAMVMRYFAEKMSEKKKQVTQKDEVRIKEEEPQSVVEKMDQQEPERKQQNSKPIQISIQQPVQKPQEKLLDEKHEFFGLSQILLNDDYYNNILRVLVNKGDSILIKNDPIEQKQTKQPVKQNNQSQNPQQRK